MASLSDPPKKRRFSGDVEGTLSSLADHSRPDSIHDLTFVCYGGERAFAHRALFYGRSALLDRIAAHIEAGNKTLLAGAVADFLGDTREVEVQTSGCGICHPVVRAGSTSLPHRAVGAGFLPLLYVDVEDDDPARSVGRDADQPLRPSLAQTAINAESVLAS